MEMFRSNEKTILQYLQTNGPTELAVLATDCGMARSSAYAAIQQLIKAGVIENSRSKGKAAFQIRGRDALERAAQDFTAQFRSLVFPKQPMRGLPVLSFVDNYLLPESLLQQLRSKYQVRIFPEQHAYINDNQFLERVGDSDVIVKYDQQWVDRKFLEQAPELKAIIFPNCFIMNIDFEACKEFGVRLFYPDPMTHQYYESAQVEYVINSALTLIKPLSKAIRDSNVDDHFDWRRNIGDDLFGKKVGIVFQEGSIRKLVQVLQAFSAEIKACNTLESPPLSSAVGLNGYETIDELWKWADLIVILDGVEVDLTRLLAKQKTPDFLITGSGLAKFKPEDLRTSMDSGKLRGVSMDTLPYSWNAHLGQKKFDQVLEPLRGLPNLIITSEASVFTHMSIRQSHARVFEILMNLTVA